MVAHADYYKPIYYEAYLPWCIAHRGHDVVESGIVSGPNDALDTWGQLQLRFTNPGEHNIVQT